MNNSEGEEFVVEQIIDKRIDGHTAYYFVKRKADLGDIYTWEPVTQLDCADLISKFEDEYKKKRISQKKVKLSKSDKSQPNQKKKKRTRAKIFPCFSCATDSPFDPNRSFRGSVCDFS